MGITSQPGEGGNYQVLAPLYEPGYHFVQKVEHLNATPDADALPPYADGRGILRYGMVPASHLSYEIVEELDEIIFVQNLRKAGGGVDLGFALTAGSTTLSLKTQVALVFFEGHDVIDIPTDQLEAVSNGYRAPTKVFLPLYAGDDKWINVRKDLNIEAAREYIKRSPNNQILDVEPSINPPIDSLSAEKPIIPKDSIFPIIDTASDIIRTNGGARYISYVAIDKPLFRDVVYLNSSVVTTGIFFGNIFKISTVAPFSTPKTVVYRYAFINVNANDPTSPPLYQWRLSETYGVAAPKIEKTPSTLLVSDADVQRDLFESSAENLHLVYNLNDAGPDVLDQFPTAPAKTGYSPLLAQAKIDPHSSFYDRNFKAQIIPLKKDSFFTQNRQETKKIFVKRPLSKKVITVVNKNGVGEQFESITGQLGSEVDHVLTDRSYVSPYHELDFGANTRIGVEYSIRNFSHTPIYTLDRSTILASTKPANICVSAFRDPCIDAIVVNYIDFETVVERIFYDCDWADAGEVPPEATLKSFMIGEVPQRTSGRTAFVPPQEELVNSFFAGSNSTVSIQADALPTGVTIDPTTISDPSLRPVLKLYEGDTTGDPTYEIAIPQGERKALINIPSRRYKNFKVEPGSGGPLQVLGAKFAFLKKPDSATVKDALTKAQIDDLKDEDFPLISLSVSAAAMSKYGQACLAFERDNRIDFAYRTSNHLQWIIVRDVIKRIPETYVNGIKTDLASKTFPSAVTPFLLSDFQLGHFYLFYVYKDRLFMKTVPIDIFIKYPSIDTGPIYDPPTEATLIDQMHSARPVVVFDNGIQDRRAGIKADIQFNNIRGDLTPPDTTTSPDLPHILTYSAAYSPVGNLYCFIESNDRIRLMSSSDRGLTWANLLPDDFYFYPQLKNGAPVRRSVDGTEAQSPSCFYYSGTGSIILALTVESSILVMNIPEEILTQETENIAESLSFIVPQVIYGNLSDDMKLRGITAQAGVLERQKNNPDDFNERVSSHRMGIASTQAGHLRLFFLDQEKKLKSLISSDSGLSWRSEAQYVADRTN